MEFANFISPGLTIFFFLAGFILGWIAKKKSVSRYKKKINSMYHEIKKRDLEILKLEDLIRNSEKINP